MWRIAQSPLCAHVFCAPGNAGIALEPRTTRVTDLPTDDHDAVVRFCAREAIDVVVVGPEAELVAGLADALRASGVRVFGPSRLAARLEGSKQFMKDICARYGIPTAAHAAFTDPEAAKRYIEEQGAPIVVKADGLAAGKGVVVAATVQEVRSPRNPSLRSRIPVR